MRFAAIADIHGNIDALDAVIADIRSQRVGDIVNLGDFFSSPLEAGKTADRLMTLGFPSVRGNHDRYLLQNDRSKMHASDAVAFDQLSAQHLKWLSQIPSHLIWRDDIFLCHATPEDDETYWLHTVARDGLVCTRPLPEIEAFASGLQQSLILCAHTHMPCAVRLSDGRLIVNPGSVGCPAYDSDQPFDHKVETGTPAASYAILEKVASDRTVAFRLVPYDTAAMVALARHRERSEWAEALATGWIKQSHP
ncbi:metallophosphoesterase family protein [Oryzifoliimicrobium ureilyticus]|uniref:metallophosphoesterase family protein n=1 Tax=Oryzifoliimicrobium ureilyticus TaxID=3113724 RepID=UPI003075F4CF